MVVYTVLIFIFIIIYILRYLSTHNHDYWKKRRVPYLTPLPFFGNHKESILLKKETAQVVREICQQFPNEPYIGTFYGTKPCLIIQSPDFLKLILAKDFYYFSGKAITDHSHREPLTKNLFFTGGDNWKVQRQNLNSIFNPTKIKGMFHLIKSCTNQLECLLKEELKRSEHIDALILYARYTIDCVTTCVFGVNSDTMSKDATKNPFIVMQRKIFDKSIIRGLKLHCRLIWPSLFYGLGFTIFEKKIYSFFYDILTGVFKHRQNEKCSRNDFVDLILSWKDKEFITANSFSSLKNGGKKLISLQVNDDLLVSQCVLFFGAGFQPTSNSLSFVLYELAKNQEIQEKVIKEIDLFYRKRNDELDYECINELPYLESCIEETLRLYPAAGVIMREVMDDYTFPTGLRLQKGDFIHIPVRHMHYNPRYFPDPEKFRPERFHGEERKQIKPFTFLPFGDGPRMCIGLRFSKMLMYAGLLTTFRNYRVELANDMPRSIKLQTTSLIVTPASGINLKFISRKV